MIPNLFAGTTTTEMITRWFAKQQKNASNRSNMAGLWQGVGQTDDTM